VDAVVGEIAPDLHSRLAPLTDELTGWFTEVIPEFRHMCGANAAALALRWRAQGAAMRPSTPGRTPADDWISVEAASSGPGRAAVGMDDAGAAGGGAADDVALLHQRADRHPPAAVDVTEAPGVGDADAGEEDLVDLGGAGLRFRRSQVLRVRSRVISGVQVGSSPHL
jgi:hypothetical protein